VADVATNKDSTPVNIYAANMAANASADYVAKMN